MTKITIVKKDGIITAFKVKGHSNFAEIGKDIVCSAISVVCEMTLSGLKDVCGLQVECLISDGFMQVKLDKSNFQNANAQTLLKTMELAFEQISKDYAKNVKMEVKEDVF